MALEPDQQSLLARLALVDTGAVSDALDKRGFSGVAAGIRPLTSGARAVGRVVTVKLSPAADQATPTRHLGTAAVESAGKGDVIVVEHPGPSDVAGWGGNLHLGASVSMVNGVIVDGPCRDIDEISGLEVPLFGRYVTPRSARGRLVETSFNEPITVAGVDVHPGDYVIADSSGVVFLSADSAPQVLAQAEAVVAFEEKIRERIRQGQAISSAMDSAYESMLTDPDDS